ncbi:protein tyrosine phosphatase-like protein, putative [Plasmodium malariae]|uniref:very-long-chain (3R)-3-hydroxyacyl-CoA dehydratase n=1 Tax=Plasmodium malariae TaxID=5858 RepID=A0A1D3SP95_PLAMA|nr:protein tyrosine phosphatase-like protein, putative [Plasmodium malariae]SCO93734.1 protein tyrosine phosphatase-like protein, putative [Plasmodium malariae]
MSLKNKFLLIYNVVCCALWIIIFFVTLQYVFNKEKYSIKTFWPTYKNLITITQSLAIFEILFTITGLIKSVVSLVTTQVCSRLFVVYLIFNYLPGNNKWKFPCLIAWAIIDAIRYLFYSLNLLNVHPHILISLRNKLPLILYPIGITSEIVCTISSLKNIHSTPYLRSFPYSMPNNLNFQIDIYYFCIFVLILYIPGSVLLYIAAMKKSKKHIKSTEKKLD